MNYKNIFVNFVVAGSSKNSIFEDWELESSQKPRFGRNWWVWIPELITNGGRFRSHENTNIDFMWLCFSLSLTVYAWKNNTKHNDKQRR